MKTFKTCILLATISVLTLGSGRISAVASDIAAIRTAIDVFHLDCGVYPAESQWLSALRENPGIAGWNGPYLHGARRDPWGNAFRYSLTNDTYVILSAGPDGKFETSDDQDGSRKTARTIGCSRTR
jgi:general secretion pathway protein G